MFSTRQFVTALAWTGLAAAAAAQGGANVPGKGSNLDRAGGLQPRFEVKHAGSGLPDAGGKISPTVGEAGFPMCFGDGTGSPCSAKPGTLGHGCENSWGLGGGLLSAEGVARVSQDTVVFTALALPPSSTVVYLQGTASLNNDRGTPFGDGVMCLSGYLTRLATKRTGDGNSVYPAPGEPSITTAGSVSPTGVTLIYQAFYRDEVPYGSRFDFNLTNAWTIHWAP